MHRGWLGLGAAFAVVVASGAAAQTPDSADPERPGSVLKDPYRYTRNVRVAELTPLQAMGKGSSARGQLGRAGYFRVRGELDESSKAARLCLQAVANEPADSTKGIEYLCSATLAGNLLMQGDIAGWATQMLRVRVQLKRDILPLLKNEREIHVAGINEPAFERFTTWPRHAIPVQAPATDISVPLQLENELPILTLNVRTATGERELRVHVDTGAAHSRIGRALAAELGLTLTEGFMAADGQAGRLYALATPVELDIGGLPVRDVSFAVLGTDDLPRIGLDVLRALGRVRINKDSLVIQAPNSMVPCTRRMATLSSLWGDVHELRYPIRTGKSNVLVKMDTGFNGVFQVRQMTPPAVPAEALVQRKNVVTIEGSEDIEYVVANVPVMIGQEVLSVPVDLVLTPAADTVFYQEWRAGFASTRRYSLYMDVAGTYGCPVSVEEAPPLFPPKPVAAPAASS
ncbi:retropepsin-like aspartic protease [Stenotrophomonas sp. S41]|uniref:retropepsin-like aspartic protease n=1 Tax=Stenotrophomonas sp. S41 TaxID=2767464 RepID=UPI001909DF10|nr:retropepsin-like aspartic protease [Stenotrophomonas sp. S41]MBK0011052.1 retropepsin-like domain-containing protein [Stenotrophomonas sp. S41]